MTTLEGFHMSLRPAAGESKSYLCIYYAEGFRGSGQIRTGGILEPFSKSGWGPKATKAGLSPTPATLGGTWQRRGLGVGVSIWRRQGAKGGTSQPVPPSSVRMAGALAGFCFCSPSTLTTLNMAKYSAA